MEWIDRVPSIIFTRVKNTFSKTIKSKYKMTNNNFSSSDSNDNDAIFPFVKVDVIDINENAEDLEGTTINGALFSVQIDVTDNQSSARANEVASEVTRTLKLMSFKLISKNKTDINKLHRITMRFRRSIDENDTL